MTPDEQTPPEGYELFELASPFLAQAGPFYIKGAGHDLSVGAFVEKRHLNFGGFAHGGFISTFADIALGYACATLVDPPTGALTLNLTIDFSGTARLGDWIESEVELYKSEGRTKFANAYILCNGKRIARASAVYADTESNRVRKES